MKSARLPRQVRTVEDLAPASWIIAETDSSLGLKVDVKFGQDFTWIRETTLGTLTGDIGVKVALGVSAGLGFNATHKYAVLLSRESADPAVQKLRLRIFKLKMNQANATFGAKAIVTPVATLLPENADDFIKGILGTHALTALEVTLPPQACLAWLNASTNKKDPVYQRLSMALQRSFKQLGYQAYFADLGRYKEVAAGSATFSVLVFSSIPDATDVRQTSSGQLELAPGQFDSFGQFHWDSEALPLRKAMVRDDRTIRALQRKLAIARERLQKAGDPDGVGGFYKDSQLTTILGSVATSPFLQGLLTAEFLVVKEAQKAALAIAAFQAKRNAATSAEAIKAITAFGSKVTNAFNAQLRGTPVGDALMPLGSLMFAEAATVFDPNLAGQASAMFTIIDVQDAVMFPPKGFPDHEALKETEIVHEETLVHEAGSSPP